MHNFTDCIQHVGSAVITYIHGDAQDIPNISRLGGQEADTFHGKIHAHMRNLIAFLRCYTNRPLEGDTSLLSSVMHHMLSHVCYAPCQLSFSSGNPGPGCC
jgi:hypothetical protein